MANSLLNLPFALPAIFSLFSFSKRHIWCFTTFFLMRIFSLDFVKDFGSVFSFLTFFWIKTHLRTRKHDFVDFFFINISASGLDSLFQSINSSNVFTLFLMSFLLSELLYSFMELFIFLFGFLLLKFLNFMLLLKKPTLYFSHMLIGL
jgi:hypothetical protein